MEERCVRRQEKHLLRGVEIFSLPMRTFDKSFFGLVLPWQESTTDYVNSIQDAINDAKAKAEDFNSREKVMNTLL